MPKKTLEQQDIQALHRARQRLVNHRTALISQMRGLLLDRGIAIAVSATRARRLIPKILSDSNDELTEMMREIVASLYAFMLQIDERIKAFDRKITAIFKASNVCQRITKIRGIGPKTATAMIAAIGDGSDFKNGRHLAAWLGLVPHQHSSGDRKVMMGITKRGIQHLRTLLIHGARAVVRTAVRKTDARRRALDNPALETAIAAANVLEQTVFRPFSGTASPRNARRGKGVRGAARPPCRTASA